MLLAAADLEQRRLGDEDMAALDQLAHMPEEEREQEGSNMGPINIGIRHDDDAVIAQFVRVELLLAYAAAQRGDHGADFGGAQHLVETRLFDVENLALQGQDGLEAPAPALLRGAAGGVALDQEQL